MPRKTGAPRPQRAAKCFDSVSDVAPTTTAAPLEVKGPSLLSDASVRAYKAGWNAFVAWCESNGQESYFPATAEMVVAYLEHAAKTRKAATLLKHLAAIAHEHSGAGYESPTGAPPVRRCLQRLRRQYGTAQDAKAPLLIEDVRRICEELPGTMMGRRDRCLILVGFAGAFRRSELVALAIEDVTFTPQGMRIRLRRSKTDQQGQGRDIAIPYGKNEATCPVRALRGWLSDSGVTSGPILRAVNRHGNPGTAALSAEAVGDIVKRLTGGLGFDTTRYAGHSLRAGLATSAAMEGADDRAIMRQTGHKSREMVDRYIRAANLWKDNAAARTGL